MKLIIAGGRNIPHNIAEEKILQFFSTPGLPLVTEIVSGCAHGVDAQAFMSSKYFNLPFKGFPADWAKHGKSAGPIRNRQMAKYGDALLLIWDGRSRGSSSMKSEMKLLDKPIYEAVVLLE